MRNPKPYEMNLNLNVRGLPLSATLHINELSNRIKQEGKKVYKLGLGQSPFPVPRAVVEELRANAHQKDYLEVKGLPALREAVAEYHSRRNGIERSANDVLIGPGSKELMFLLQFVYYGDLVIPAPSWVSYAPQAKIIGRQIVWVQTSEASGWHLMAEDLERVCAVDHNRPRIVILNYPSNPTGITYTIAELKKLAHVARDHRVILLSDEIYGELHFDGHHVSIAKFYPEGTIISSGLSKWCGAGGWRLGTFSFPPSLSWLLNAMASVASETFTSTSAPIQYAAVRAFKGGIDIERYLRNSRRVLKALGLLIHRKLRKAGIASPKPQGAFYLFCNFGQFKDKLKNRQISTSVQLASRLLEDTGVAILPGSAFGRPEDELTTRLAFVDFDGAKTLADVETISPDREIDEDFLQHHAGQILEAVDLVCDWVKDL